MIVPQDQPLFPDFFFASSVLPAPSVLPLHPLAEPPAPALSPLQALLPVAQLLREKVDPAIRPAIQKPARIFLRSSTSMVASWFVGIRPFPGAGNRQTEGRIEKAVSHRELLYCTNGFSQILSKGRPYVNDAAWRMPLCETHADCLIISNGNPISSLRKLIRSTTGPDTRHPR